MEALADFFLDPRPAAREAAEPVSIITKFTRDFKNLLESKIRLGMENKRMSQAARDGVRFHYGATTEVGVTISIPARDSLPPEDQRAVEDYFAYLGRIYDVHGTFHVDAAPGNGPEITVRGTTAADLAQGLGVSYPAPAAH